MNTILQVLADDSVRMSNLKVIGIISIAVVVISIIVWIITAPPSYEKYASRQYGYCPSRMEYEGMTGTIGERLFLFVLIDAFIILAIAGLILASK